jgi:adenylate kinase
MKIIIFGPQGSGKGTQAELIARRHGLPYISTGDIFRFHIKNNTDLGQKINEQIKQGHLVDDQTTNEIVNLRLQQPDCVSGFVLDGYPRTRNQADFLDSLVDIDLAILIDITDQQAIERLNGRLACKCGLSYHLIYNPPVKEGVCDKCGNELFRRDDDMIESITKRLSIYHEQTKPLLEHYRSKQILREVDGQKDIEGVYNQIEKNILEFKK